MRETCLSGQSDATALLVAHTCLCMTCTAVQHVPPSAPQPVSSVTHRSHPQVQAIRVCCTAWSGTPQPPTNASVSRSSHAAGMWPPAAAMGQPGCLTSKQGHKCVTSVWRVTRSMGVTFTHSCHCWHWPQVRSFRQLMYFCV